MKGRRKGRGKIFRKKYGKGKAREGHVIQGKEKNKEQTCKGKGKPHEEGKQACKEYERKKERKKERKERKGIGRKIEDRR